MGNTTFNLGDTVMLKSGGQKMTVVKLGNYIEVLWMAPDGAILTERVIGEALMQAPPATVPPPTPTGM